MFIRIKDSHTRLFLQHTLLVVFFAAAYYFAHLYLVTNNPHKHGGLKHSVENKDDHISFFDCVRFSLVTQTTVGYGALVPTHPLTQYINMLQLMTIYGVLILSFI